MSKYRKKPGGIQTEQWAGTYWGLPPPPQEEWERKVDEAIRREMERRMGPMIASVIDVIGKAIREPKESMMNVYEYVVVYRVGENPRSAATGYVGLLELDDKLPGSPSGPVGIVVADNPEALKKNVIRNVALPDGVAIEDVEVLVRPFVSSAEAAVTGWPDPLHYLRLASNR